MTATGFYTGYLPLAPGTWASWAAAMLAFVIGHFFPEYSKLICFFAALFFFGVGVPASHFWSKAVKRKDPGFIVIDEWAGHCSEQQRRRYRHLYPGVQADAIKRVFG